MERQTTFAEVLDAADGLSIDEQETLVEILHRRIAQLRRTELVAEVAAARQEFGSGNAHPVQPDDLIREIFK
jgi:hypothetical protein